MRLCSSSGSWILFLLCYNSILLKHSVSSFVLPSSLRSHPFVSNPKKSSSTAPFILLQAAEKDDNEDEETPPKKENPYQDPNYPELEFVDYSDPEYVVDQGVSDEFFDPEQELESMREERRKKNDEFQFQTYYKDILKEGKNYKGLWTVYQTSTFAMPEEDVDENGFPRLLQAKKVLKVVSTGNKITVDSDSEWDVDKERICHEQQLSDDDNDDDEDTPKNPELEQGIVSKTYWPDELSAYDFRGEQGTMVVGNAYTICQSSPINDKSDSTTVGPYKDHRVELGIKSNELRFRIKLDYETKESELSKFLLESNTIPPPALHLKSLIVCRESMEDFPDPDTSASLYGLPGAEGGLYDPPPVGSDEQASQYMLIELEGRATILFPYCIPQQEDDSYMGWVTSLDWAPDTQRYQVDRKVKSGKDLTNLRSLELSEVQSQDAERYRPRDGGMNMRQ